MAENDTKKKIKRIAIELFQENGFEDVTINQICEKSSVNKHTFYYYFKSKDDLLKDYYEFPYDMGTEYFVEMLNAPNYVEQLWLSYKPFLDYIKVSGKEIARQMFIKNVTHDVGTFRGGHAKQHAHLAMQKGIIEKGQAAGEMRNLTDPENLCVIVQQMFMSTVFLWCMTRGDFDIFRFLRGDIEMIVDAQPEFRQYPDLKLADIWQAHHNHDDANSKEQE